MKPQSRLLNPLCIQLSKCENEDVETFSSSPEETNETGSGRFIQETSICNGGFRKSQFKPKTMTERYNNTLTNVTTQFSRPQSPANPQNTSIFINNSPLINGNNNNILSRQNTPIKKSNFPLPFFLSFSSGNIPSQSVPPIGLNTPTNTATLTQNNYAYPIIQQKPNTRVLSVFSTPQSRGSTHTVESFGEEADRIHSECEQGTNQQQGQQQQYIDPRYSHFIELIENIKNNKDASENTVDTETVADVLGDFRHFRILVKPQFRVDCARKLMKHLEIGKKQKGEFFFHRGEMCGEHQLVCVLSGRVAVYTVKSESDINQEMDLLGKIHQLTSQANKIEKENNSYLSEETQKTAHQLRQRCENATEELSKIVNRDEDELLRAYNPAKYFKTENISCFKREKYIDHGQTLGDEQIVNGGVPQTTAVALTEVIYFFIRSSVYRDIFSLEISKNAYVCQVLRNNFPGAKDDSLRRLSYDFKEEIYDYNKVIYEQNDPANLFMIVRSGEVEARKKIILQSPTEINKQMGNLVQQLSSSPLQSQKDISMKDANLNYTSPLFSESSENTSPQLLVKKKGKYGLKEVSFGIIGEGQLLGIEDIYSAAKIRSFKAVSKTMDTVVYYITRKQLEDIIVLNDDYEMKKELRQQSKIKREYYDSRFEQLAKGAEVGSAQFQESLVQQQQQTQGQQEPIKTLPFRSNRKQLSLNYAQFQQGDNIDRMKCSNGKSQGRMSYSEFKKNEMGYKNDPEQSESKEDESNVTSNNYCTSSSRSIPIPMTDHEQLMATQPVELNTSDKNEFEKARRRLLKLRNLANENKKNYRLKSQNSLLNSLLKKSTSLRIGLQSALSHKVDQNQENENNEKQIIISTEDKDAKNEKRIDIIEQKTIQEDQQVTDQQEINEVDKIRSNREITLPEKINNANKKPKIDLIIGKNDKKRYIFDSINKATQKQQILGHSEESPLTLSSQEQKQENNQDGTKQTLNHQQQEQMSINVYAPEEKPSKLIASLVDLDKQNNNHSPNFHNPFKLNSNNNQSLSVSVSASKSEKEHLPISQSLTSTTTTTAGASLLAIKITKNGFKTNPLYSYRSSLDNILPSSTYCLQNGFKSTRFTSRSSLAGISGLKTPNQTTTSIPQSNTLNNTSSPGSLPQLSCESTSKRSNSSANLCGIIMPKHPTGNICQSQGSSQVFFGERKTSWVDLVGTNPLDDQRLKYIKTSSSTARKTLNGFNSASNQQSITLQQQQQLSSSQVQQNPLKFILTEQLQKRQISTSTQTYRNNNNTNNISTTTTDSQKPGNINSKSSSKGAKRVVFTSERQQSLENTPNKNEIDYNQAPMMIQKKILFSK